MKKICAALFIFVCGVIQVQAAAVFDRTRDTFSFSNDTLWAYNIDAEGRLSMHAREHRPEYSRRCFVMCRAVLQFHKFVEFAPAQARVSDLEYRRLVRRISRIPVWMPSRGKKIVLPGYADLRTFSKANAKLLQAELGEWWPSYFRVGNWRMAGPFPRVLQKKLARDLVRKVDRNEIQAIFLTRFRPINHCVIVYGYERRGDNVRFLAYDPNDEKSLRPITFDSASSSFLFPRTAYFNGGRVNAFKAYLSPLQ